MKPLMRQLWILPSQQKHVQRWPLGPVFRLTLRGWTKPQGLARFGTMDITFHTSPLV